jgi:hypothetical protein
VLPTPTSSSKDIKLYVLNPAAEGEEDPWAPNPNGFDNATAKIFPTPNIIPTSVSSPSASQGNLLKMGLLTQEEFDDKFRAL